MSKQLVKERVIKYLMEDLLVPHDMIDTDVPLAEFEEGAEGTLDIVVNVKDEEDYYAPVMIVTCMDEDIELEGEVVQKQIDFLEDVDNMTMAGRLVLTNGDSMMYADWTGEEYDTEASLPTYEQMVKEFFEMEEIAKKHEEAHNHEGCGCSHEEGHECGCGDDCGCKH
ncbi:MULTISPECIES: type I restriction enzyme HsdR N-terminal domain-containing protein [Romboutsia]|uniref:Type I restriction enzyme R protein N terminus (HSDR_N) n=1 Tax=Romboutsia hominis TaxID=1507512 RepID=A0A2P2BS97_9FIRM|nr:MULTISPECIES: type I restriction enzyme HsdR N-terminal domain-containing protein [Romboutsia]MCH1960502.1 type I restriction enzyme HsdR N-terminal domain-containing protein [Romboutsia hominis]MCH1969066.1 type I restriction enzyme HsdR N-terminal domain-containing protein [Romboutsia hominis]MDB8791141.1 type I restriction enzyme HsdR N-terminal domain-containing protein [Romboutsia sp. 1001216sp1]MDB8793442.1 type I restriction enzyme HsdR N-terminal domain-containing protein [Romboutsia